MIFVYKNRIEIDGRGGELLVELACIIEELAKQSGIPAEKLLKWIRSALKEADKDEADLH